MTSTVHFVRQILILDCEDTQIGFIKKNEDIETLFTYTHKVIQPKSLKFCQKTTFFFINNAPTGSAH